MTLVPEFPPGMSRIFQLATDPYTVEGNKLRFPGAVVVTSETVTDEVVTNAWTYAVRYSAKGLDYPDYDAALKLLIKRHPSWQIVGRHVHSIKLNLAGAKDDIPET